VLRGRRERRAAPPPQYPSASEPGSPRPLRGRSGEYELGARAHLCAPAEGRGRARSRADSAGVLPLKIKTETPHGAARTARGRFRGERRVYRRLRGGAPARGGAQGERFALGDLTDVSVVLQAELPPLTAASCEESGAGQPSPARAASSSRSAARRAPAMASDGKQVVQPTGDGGGGAGKEGNAAEGGSVLQPLNPGVPIRGIRMKFAVLAGLVEVGEVSNRDIVDTIFNLVSWPPFWV